VRDTVSVILQIVGGIALAAGFAIGVVWFLERAHPQAEIAELKTYDRRRIDPAGMQGSFERFDVVGNVDFATRLAKIWASDAVLDEVTAWNLTRGGVLDARHEHVEYTFVTAATKAGHQEGHDKIDDEGEPRAEMESLTLDFREGELMAITKEAEEPTASSTPPKIGCTSAKLSELIETKVTPPYTVVLEFVSKKSREWHFRAFEMGEERHGRVEICAATCALEGTEQCVKR
jgi:hypothetical protein